jgi:hypothetical protein
MRGRRTMLNNLPFGKEMIHPNDIAPASSDPLLVIVNSWMASSANIWVFTISTKA